MTKALINDALGDAATSLLRLCAAGEVVVVSEIGTGWIVLVEHNLVSVGFLSSSLWAGAWN
jgi:hypothetical protein